MAEIEEKVVAISKFLDKDYRGINLAVYALATAGLAISIHKIRPVSKFSKASKIPNHFINKHEPLKGVYAGVQHSPMRLLIDHKPPIWLPLWHSSKPPLTVKLWGVNIVSANAVNWIECVAKERQVTLKPIARDNDELVSTVLLHLPQPKTKKVETIDVGKTLIELGFAKATVPEKAKQTGFESKLAPVLLTAEARAKSHRNGIWYDELGPLPFYIVLWRKSLKTATAIISYSVKKLMYVLVLASKSALAGAKRLTKRSPPKQIQTT